EEGVPDDRNSSGTCRPLTIEAHTNNVCGELDRILGAVGVLTDGCPDRLVKAARWHDAGKGHPVFQDSVYKVNPALPQNGQWAKSGAPKPLRHGRRSFRHELASPLAALQSGLPFEIAYLIATHHGKVRLGIRALPGEAPPEQPAVLFAL